MAAERECLSVYVAENLAHSGTDIAAALHYWKKLVIKFVTDETRVFVCVGKSRSILAPVLATFYVRQPLLSTSVLVCNKYIRAEQL